MCGKQRCFLKFPRTRFSRRSLANMSQMWDFKKDTINVIPERA